MRPEADATDLDLVDTGELIKAVSKRFDRFLFVGAKILEAEEMNPRVELTQMYSCLIDALGLLEYADPVLKDCARGFDQEADQD